VNLRFEGDFVPNFNPAHAASRRALLCCGAGVLGAALAPKLLRAEVAATAPAPSLGAMICHPLLATTLYRHQVGGDVAPDGAAGANRSGYRYIEEQRQGAEWIVRGLATSKPDWVAQGWRILDWGVARQQPDGGFGGDDAFHSTSFFVEALARSCLLDKAGATPLRLDCARRGAEWLMQPEIEAQGAKGNAPFTHRRYVLAAALGEAAAAAGDKAAEARAALWAKEGISLQQPDGTDPERGGYDAGYQMAGVLYALRYLPVCKDAGLRGDLRAALRRAVAPELARQRPDGGIDAEGSTRVGLESARSGKTKDMPYHEIIQALVFGAQALPAPEWAEPAERIARNRGW